MEKIISLLKGNWKGILICVFLLLYLNKCSSLTKEETKTKVLNEIIIQKDTTIDSLEIITIRDSKIKNELHQEINDCKDKEIDNLKTDNSDKTKELRIKDKQLKQLKKNKTNTINGKITLTNR